MDTDQQIALAVAVAVGGIGALVFISALGLAALARADIATADEELRGRARSRPKAWVIISRAIGRKCPICGRGRMFRTHFQMNAVCPSCGSVFWKDKGEWLGPLVIDYSVAVVSALLTWFVTSEAGLSDRWEIIACALVATVTGVAIIPWSRSFWTAFLYVTGETTEGGRKLPRLASRSLRYRLHGNLRIRRRPHANIRLVKSTDKPK